MKQLKKPAKQPILETHRPAGLIVQAPLPDFLHTLPKLLPAAGMGAVLGATAPLPPPKEAPNDQ